MDKKKILVNTVTCWSDKVGSNTMESLFLNYGSENLANIYIRPEVPDSQVCGRYFQISENRVIKSIFNKKLTL